MVTVQRQFHFTAGAGAALVALHHRRPSCTLGAALVLAFGSFGIAPARAGCVFGVDAICSGPVPNLVSVFQGFISVSFLAGETQGSDKGVILFAQSDRPNIAFAMDATSSIAASSAGLYNGSAIDMRNSFGSISTTTPSFAGISGNLTSTTAYGFDANTNNAAGNISIVQNASSTISGNFGGIRATAAGTGGAVNITANGRVSGTGTGNGIDASTNNAAGDITILQTASSTVTSNGSVGIRAHVAGAGGEMNITANGSVTTTKGSAIWAESEATSNDAIIITNNGRLRASGGAGIVSRGTSGAMTVNSNAAILSGTGGAGTLSYGVIAWVESASAKANVTVNLTADIGSLTDRAAANGVSMLNYGGIANTTGMNLSINNASVFAVGDAVTANFGGAGNVVIVGTGSGTVSSSAGFGVSAFATSSIAAPNASIKIDLAQDVSGANGGITAMTDGAGAIAITARGKVTASGGSGILATNTSASGGRIDVAVASGGVVIGSANAVAGAAGTAAFNINNAGTIQGSVQVTGSSTAQSNFNNQGTWNNGGAQSNYNGNLNNSGVVLTAGFGSAVMIAGNAVNTGTIINVQGLVDVLGSFANNGTYLSFAGANNFKSLTVGTAGYFQAKPGDQYAVGGDFINNSTRSADWKTEPAALRMTASAGTRQWTLAGADRGASLAGYNANFAWGSLEIDVVSGEKIMVGDGNATAGASFYTGLFTFSGDSLAHIAQYVFSDYNIYYDPTLAGNAALHGASYALGGAGFLKPISSVPEPTSLALMFAGVLATAQLARRRRLDTSLRA